VILTFLALAAAQASAPSPGPQSDEARLRACAALVRAAPEQAMASANAWLEEPGAARLSARRCLGLAFTALEQWPAAATVYQQAARDAEAANDPSRADFWVQAGNAWLAAGEAPRALQALDAALAVPNLTQELRGQVHLDRARVQVALGHADRARQDLDRALQLGPADGFAWYLSAALARRLNDGARARTDIARALELAPDNPDVLLLAGTIAGQSGDMAQAERLYRRVVEVAADSDAGREAAASLATLREVEVPASGPAPAQASPVTPAPARPSPPSR
jgi:tetratricopeptide (TPR) repeat protein